MQCDLSTKHCQPCEGGVPPLTLDQANELNAQLPKPWEIVDVKQILKEFVFKDFKEALSFVNQVGAIAEDQGHHPDIHLVNYKKVIIELSTHAIDGLSENDFILAAKIEEI